MNATRRPLTALSFGVVLLALSCADPSPMGVGAEPRANLLGALTEDIGLLSCSPLPYDSAAVTIGAEGGLLHVGPHQLSVPAGALSGPVTISAVVRPEHVNRVDFAPDGLRFLSAAELTMSYANCDPLGSTLPKRVAQVTDALTVLEYLLSLDDASSQTVIGRLEHFSSYAVAW